MTNDSTLSNEFMRLKEECTTLSAKLQDLNALKAENELVLQELKIIETGVKVYQKQGVALLLRSREESINHVEQRLKILTLDIENQQKLFDASCAKMNQVAQSLKSGIKV